MAEPFGAIAESIEQRCVRDIGHSSFVRPRRGPAKGHPTEPVGHHEPEQRTSTGNLANAANGAKLGRRSFQVASNRKERQQVGPRTSCSCMWKDSSPRNYHAIINLAPMLPAGEGDRAA